MTLNAKRTYLLITSMPMNKYKKKKDNGNVSSECMPICTFLSCRLFQKYSLMVNGTGDDSIRKRKRLETKLIILQSGLESILYSPKMVDN